ncbi:MAG: DUF6891 domain-containing protein [Thermoguttaceae bacterium]
MPIEPNSVPPEVVDEIQRPVAREVQQGFHSEEEIVAGVTESLEDEHKRSDLRPYVSRTVARMLQEHRRIQARWKTPTDCDRLDLAFANLEDQGIVARQNFTCCQNCGHAEIGAEIEQAQKLREVKGYVFYHMQDTESAVETGTLWLAYGSLTGDEEESVAIGHAIVEAIRHVGLAVKWNGSLNQRICATGIDWKRRRN